MSHSRGPGSCLPLWPAALWLVQRGPVGDAPESPLAAGDGGTDLEQGGGFAGVSK